MKLSIVASLLVLLLMASCKKNKFTTEPQVHVKSITPSIVNKGNIITMKADYTDKEGDLDSAYIVYKWYNGPTAVKHDTFRYNFKTLNLPVNTKKAEIDVIFEYNSGNVYPGAILPGVNPKDTTGTLGLILIDKAGHRSNYSESEPIRLKKT